MRSRSSRLLRDAASKLVSHWEIVPDQNDSTFVISCFRFSSCTMPLITLITSFDNMSKKRDLVISRRFHKPVSVIQSILCFE